MKNKIEKIVALFKKRKRRIVRFHKMELIQNYGYPTVTDKEMQAMDIDWEVG